jgi:hypothetical protein
MEDGLGGKRKMDGIGTLSWVVLVLVLRTEKRWLYIEVYGG